MTDLVAGKYNRPGRRHGRKIVILFRAGAVRDSLQLSLPLRTSLHDA